MILRLLLLALLGGQDVVAQPAEKPPMVDGRRWYPRQAIQEGIEGRVVLSCIVQADGSVQDCRIDEETPKGAGFGDSALRMSTQFRMKTATRDGASPVGARVRIPVRFTPAEEPAPVPPPE